MADTTPPHPYVPRAPVEISPGGRFTPARERIAAFAAVLEGVPLGAYGQRMIDWLAGLDDTTCRALASVMWECRVTGLPGTVTEWGVRFNAPPGRGHDVFQAYDSEEDARRQHAVTPETDGWSATLMRRQAAPWTPVPGQEGGQ